MLIHEYQAKEILSKSQIPVVPGTMATSPEEAFRIAERIGKPVVVKAQVHVGGRGKAGGILKATSPLEAKQAASKLLGHSLKGQTVKKVLVENQLQIEREFYLGFTMDRQRKENVLIFSMEGGVDIEELAVSKPDAVGKYFLNPCRSLTDSELDSFLNQWDVPHQEALKKIILQFDKLYRRIDAELAEINPLALTPAGFVALDAKMNIDDNGLFRQPDIACFREESETDPIEAEAHKHKIAYVRLGGHVGIIGNGAGLVMGTMDEVSRAGGKPANFLDIGGGAKANQVKQALELILMVPNVRGIFFNIFGGITRCDEVAKGILEAIRQTKISIPMVIRLAGTNAEEGRAILSNSSLTAVPSMQEGATKIVELIGGSS